MTYTRTDGLYSLEVSARGLDVMYPDGSRYYLASLRDAASEELVRQHLGQVLFTVAEARER